MDERKRLESMNKLKKLQKEKIHFRAWIKRYIDSEGLTYFRDKLEKDLIWFIHNQHIHGGLVHFTDLD